MLVCLLMSSVSDTNYVYTCSSGCIWKFNSKCPFLDVSGIVHKLSLPPPPHSSPPAHLPQPPLTALDQHSPGQYSLYHGAGSETGSHSVPGLLPRQNCSTLRRRILQVFIHYYIYTYNVALSTAVVSGCVAV